MAYKDKDKQKEANREANKRYRERKQGITQKVSREQGITQPVNDTFLDAVGTAHKADYEGRRKDWDLLDSWYKGQGMPYQQRIGALAMQYSVIKSDFDKEGKLAHYLGVAYAKPVVLPKKNYFPAAGVTPQRAGSGR